MDNNKGLTLDEIYILHEYITKMDALAAREPDDRSGDDWKAWKKEAAAVNKEYDAIINKALAAMTDRDDAPQNVAELLKGYIAGYSPQVEFLPDAPDAKHTPPAKLSKYGLMDDKATQTLISGFFKTREINGQLRYDFGIDQAGSRRKTEIPVLIGLTYEGNQIQTSRRIEGRDETIFTAVSNVIYGLRRDGITPPYNITPDDIWRTMHGITDNRKTPTAKQRADICRRMDKMRFTRLYMDISEEIRANYIAIKDDRLTEGVFDGYYLPAEKLTFTTEKGKKLEGYSFSKMPFLFSYNVAKGHAVLVSGELLNTTDTTGNEGDTAEFKRYLLREIQRMYLKKRDSTRILYETIYKDAAIKTPAERTQRGNYQSDSTYNANVRKAAKADRDKINALLESWKTKKYILDYSPVKRGRAFVGVEIKLSPKEFKKALPEKL